MRYQSPIANAFNQYWEEQLILGDASQYWQNIFASSKYLYAEYILSNFILMATILGRVFTLRPLVSAVSNVYHVYGLNWILKRAIDIMGATIGLVLAIPIFIVVSILVKLDSPGPVFYRQERIGQNRRRGNRRGQMVTTAADRRASDRRQSSGFGRPFQIFKFRTMRQDAELQTGPVWATKRDPRITRLGAILRATRIDEIPQLFNVIKGDMSLVGPRPERAFFIEKLATSIDGYQKRLMVKPGITGLAQVEHKYDESIDDVKTKVKYDLSYVYNFRIIGDIKIILKTVYVVFAAKGM
jgi:lipopolysaccharide/colanic/teichoic acid biosynthesis glycosyltransferase